MDSIWCQPPAFCPAIRRKPHPERLRSVLQYHAFVIRRTERLKRWHMGRALKLHHKISSPLDCYYCKYTFRTCWTSLGMQEIWPKTFRKQLSIVNKQGKIGKWKLSKYLSVLQVCSHCKHGTQCFTPQELHSQLFCRIRRSDAQQCPGSVVSWCVVFMVMLQEDTRNCRRFEWKLLFQTVQQLQSDLTFQVGLHHNSSWYMMIYLNLSIEILGAAISLCLRFHFIDWTFSPTRFQDA